MALLAARALAGLPVPSPSLSSLPPPADLAPKPQSLRTKAGGIMQEWTKEMRIQTSNGKMEPSAVICTWRDPMAGPTISAGPTPNTQ